MNDRVDIGPDLVDGAVDVALGVRLPAAGVDRGAVERKLHDVGRFDALRSPGARQAIAVGVAGMADADVAEGVDDPLAGEDTVGGHELFEGLLDHGGHYVGFALE